MISDSLFLLNIDSNSVPSYRTGSLAISRFLGSELLEISCDDEPNRTMMNLKENKAIVHLIGDAAMPNSSGLSWVETLGHWRRPLALMIKPDDSGNIPGIASAYVSLCKSKHVCLVGVIQLGGYWNQKARKLDCLPWCGRIPEELFEENSSLDSISFDQSLVIEELILNIKKQINALSL